MLWLVGLGLKDEKDLSLRAVDVLKKCDKVYLERYTALNTNSEELQKLVRTPVVELSREQVESEAKFIDEAKNSDVALLVGGDPLTATTHAELMLRCKEKNVQCKVVHNASILTAVGETGLQLYKFGKVTSIPHWKENYKPTSFMDVLKVNREAGLHTLFLLDTQPPMSANEALQRILDLGFEGDAFVCARLGADSLIRFGDAKSLVAEDFGLPMHCIVVPGKMDEVEKESAETLRNKSR